jgi:outer membrane protein assembly factor BamB
MANLGGARAIASNRGCRSSGRWRWAVGAAAVLALPVAVSGFAAAPAGASAALSAHTGASAQPALAAGLQKASAEAGTPEPGRPGTQLWVARYNGPDNILDGANSVAVSPGGDTVYVTGTSYENGNLDGGRDYNADYATVAYNAATGAERWVARYNSPGNGNDTPGNVAVSPGGDTVYVTGTSRYNYATVAYDAATGAERWVARDNVPGFAYSQVVSPDGDTVYVTGTSDGDYATVAYNAATGAERWVAHYNDPANYDDQASSVAVSPDGDTVYVTGESDGGTAMGYDYATVAYNAATGAERWAARYNDPGNGNDDARVVVVSPDGHTVYVTGHSDGGGGFSRYNYATVAYNAATGAERWAARYNGPGDGHDSPTNVAVSPGGDTVYVSGTSYGGTATGMDYATVAYNAATGAERWVARYNSPGNGNDDAGPVAVSPIGRKVFVTGCSSGGAVVCHNYVTLAYMG